MDFNQFTDWSTLLTYSGASVCTAILTQIFKGLFDRLPIRLPTRFFSYLVALMLLFASTFFTGSRTAGDYALCAVNAAIVSLSANGSFDMIKSFQCDTVNRDDFGEADDEDNS